MTNYSQSLADEVIRLPLPTQDALAAMLRERMFQAFAPYSSQYSFQDALPRITQDIRSSFLPTAGLQGLSREDNPNLPSQLYDPGGRIKSQIPFQWGQSILMRSLYRPFSRIAHGAVKGTERTSFDEAFGILIDETMSRTIPDYNYGSSTFGIFALTRGYGALKNFSRQEAQQSRFGHYEASALENILSYEGRDPMMLPDQAPYHTPYIDNPGKHPWPFLRGHFPNQGITIDRPGYFSSPWGTRSTEAIGDQRLNEFYNILGSHDVPRRFTFDHFAAVERAVMPVTGPRTATSTALLGWEGLPALRRHLSELDSAASVWQTGASIGGDFQRNDPFNDYGYQGRPAGGLVKQVGSERLVPTVPSAKQVMAEDQAMHERLLAQGQERQGLAALMYGTSTTPLAEMTGLSAHAAYLNIAAGQISQLGPRGFSDKFDGPAGFTAWINKSSPEYGSTWGRARHSSQGLVMHMRTNTDNLLGEYSESTLDARAQEVLLSSPQYREALQSYISSQPDEHVARTVSVMKSAQRQSLERMGISAIPTSLAPQRQLGGAVNKPPPNFDDDRYVPKRMPGGRRPSEIASDVERAKEARRVLTSDFPEYASEFFYRGKYKEQEFDDWRHSLGDRRQTFEMHHENLRSEHRFSREEGMAGQSVYSQWAQELWPSKKMRRERYNGGELNWQTSRTPVSGSGVLPSGGAPPAGGAPPVGGAPPGGSGDPPEDPPPPPMPEDEGPTPRGQGDFWDEGSYNVNRNRWDAWKQNATPEQRYEASQRFRAIGQIPVRERIMPFAAGMSASRGFLYNKPHDEFGYLQHGGPGGPRMVTPGPNGEVILTGAETGKAFDVAQQGVMSAINQGGFMEGTDNGPSIAATIKQRLNKFIVDYVDNEIEVAKKAGGESAGNEVAQKMRAFKYAADKFGEVAVQGMADFEEVIASETDPNYRGRRSWRTKAYSSSRWMPRGRTEAAMESDPRLREYVDSLGGIDNIPPNTTFEGSSGTYSWGPGGGSWSGGGYSRGGGNIRGGRGIFGSGVGPALYGLYLTKRFWGYTAGPELEAASQYSQLIAETGPLGSYGAGFDMRGTPAALAGQQSQAQIAQQRAAHGLFGIPMGLGAQAMTNPQVAETASFMKVASGVAIGGYMAGGMLGGMGMFAGGGAAGMTAGASAFGMAGGLIAGAAGTAWNYLNIGRQAVNVAGPMMYGEGWKPLEGVGDMLGRSWLAARQFGGMFMHTEDDPWWQGPEASNLLNEQERAERSERFVTMAEEMGGRSGLSHETYLDPLQKLQAAYGDEIAPGSSAMRSAEASINQMITEGVDLTDPAAQYAAMRGFAPGTPAFRNEMTRYIVDMDAGQRATATSRATRFAQFGAQIAQYGTSGRQGTAIASRYGIDSQPQMNAAHALLGAAGRYGDLGPVGIGSIVGMSTGMNTYQTNMAASFADPLMQQGMDPAQAMGMFSGMTTPQMSAMSTVYGQAMAYGYSPQQLISTFTSTSLGTQQQSLLQMVAPSIFTYGGVNGINRATQAIQSVAYMGPRDVGLLGGLAQQAAAVGVDPTEIIQQVSGLTSAAAYRGEGQLLSAPQQNFLMQVAPGAMMGGADISDLIQNVAQAPMSPQTANTMGQMAQGNMYAWSWNSYQTGSTFGRFFDQSRNPIFQTDFKSYLSMMAQQANFGNTAAQGAMANVGAGPGMGFVGVQDVANYFGSSDMEAMQSWYDGGARGRTALHTQRMANYQMAGIGIALQGIQQQRNFLWGAGSGGTYQDPTAGSMWGLQDQMRGLQYQSTMANFAYSEEQLQSSYAYANQMAGFQWQGMQLNRGMQQWNAGFGATGMALQQQYVQGQWQFQDQVNNLQYSWQMQDFDDAIRSSSGRDRKKLIEQQERATVMFNLQSENTEEQRDYQEEIWKREQQRHQKRVQYETQLYELEKKRFEVTGKYRDQQYEEEMKALQRRKKEFKEQYELQSKMIELQREHQAKSLELQEASLGVQAAAAEEQAEYNAQMLQAQEDFGDTVNQFKQINEFDNVKTTLRALEDAIAEADGVGVGTWNDVQDTFKKIEDAGTSKGPDLIVSVVDAINGVSVSRINLILQLLAEF